jgi:hypothetical protein
LEKPASWGTEGAQEGGERAQAMGIVEGKGSTFERITVHFLRESDMSNFERILIFEGKPINF